MNDEHLVTIGGELKALGDGRIGGYLVRFGTPDMPDLTGDYFTADTDFDLDDGEGKSTVLYHHGLDAKLGRRKLGRADLRQDDLGVWMESQLAMRDEYEQAIYGMVEAGKMGLSSGTAPHLVEREPLGRVSKITRWPLGLDASITPVPAEPRTSVMTIKSYLDMAEPFVKALLPQADAVSTAADATEDSQPEPTTQERQPDEVKTMDNDKVDALTAQITALAGTVDALKTKLEAEPAINPMQVETKTQPATPKDKPEGFKTFGEQLDAVRRSMTPGMSHDRRLDGFKAITGMSETVPEDGGYLVQTDFATELLRLTHETGLLTSRVRRVPVSANANGLTINAVKETTRATGSRWGGVQVYWREEAGTVTAKRPEFRRMKLQLNSLMGLCYATDEVLADATALGSVIQQAFSEEFAFVLDDTIIRGTGVGQPMGILNSNAFVSVTKENGQAADTVVYQNVLKMWSRLWARSRNAAVWYIHQDVLPQLHAMAMPVGTGGVPVYMPAGGLSGSPYSTLYGRPVIEIEQADTVGDQGDIMLLDLSQYLMIDKGGLEAAQSIHVHFIYAENTFRFILRTDGQPIWNSPLTLFNSTTTVAPFVLLDAR